MRKRSPSGYDWSDKTYKAFSIFMATAILAFISSMILLLICFQ